MGVEGEDRGRGTVGVCGSGPRMISTCKRRQKAHRNQAIPSVVPTEPLLGAHCLPRVTSRLSRDVTGWQSLMRPDLNCWEG